MPYITVDKENSGNIDLYYEDHGAGRPVVLIHGWPLNGASWEKQLSVLLDSRYRVITYDRRGFGLSGKPVFGYDYDTLAEDLHKLVTTLDLRDITLAGFSMGGGEVARYLGEYGSERVTSAVFISAITPFLLRTPGNPEGVDNSVFEEIQQAIVADRPAFLKKFLTDFYSVGIPGSKQASDEVLRLSWNIAAAASPLATHDCVSAWTTDFRKDLQSIDIPTLVIHGDHDLIVPFASSGKRMPEFVKGSKLVVVEGGPHGIVWSHEQKVNKELVTFLGQAIQKKAAA